MKKLIIMIVAVISTAFLINSCKKTGGEINPLSSVSNNGIGSYLVLDSVLNLNLNSAAIASSTIGIDVHYYPGGEAVDHVILFASSSSSFDTTQWHLIKSIPYTSPKTALTVTGTELGSALGIDPSSFAPGTSYTVFTRVITKSGKTYDAFNTGDNSGSGLISGTAYNSAFFFTANVVCPFTGSMAGDYNIITDAWQDYVPLPQLIPGAVTDGPGPNQLSLHVYPGPAAGVQTGPMIVDVDPATGNATIEESTIGTYGGTTTTVTGSGNVFSCTGTISLSVDFVIGGSDQGAFNMVIVKKN
jgi:hypothetical protein